MRSFLVMVQRPSISLEVGKTVIILKITLPDTYQILDRGIENRNQNGRCRGLQNEKRAALVAALFQYLALGHKEELGIRVDEPGDQPGTSHPVDVNMGSGYPFHWSSPWFYSSYPVSQTEHL